MAISIVKIDNNEEKLLIMRSLTSAFVDSDRKKHTEEYFKKICDYAEFIIAKEDDRMIGFCAFYNNNYETKEAYITLVAVSPNSQEKGIGTRLINETKKYAIASEMVKLKLEVNKSNKRALGFYKKNGFNICNENQESYFMDIDLL